MPANRPPTPLSRMAFAKTCWMGCVPPVCSTVFAKSSGIVALAAVAPAQQGLMVSSGPATGLTLLSMTFMSSTRFNLTL